jgi:hypothetical protein
MTTSALPLQRGLAIAALASIVASVSSGCGTHSTAAVEPTASLPAPDQGTGFQFATGPFAVPPGVEAQSCFFFQVKDLARSGGLPVDQPVNLHRVRIAQKDGSHHMNLFRVRTIVGLDPTKGVVRNQDGVGECFKSTNWADWPLVANTQQKGDLDWTYPDGVANVFQPDEWIMLQTHFVNATSQQSPDAQGAVTVNFYTIAKEEVRFELGTLFATTQSIRVCEKNPTPTFSHGCHIKPGSSEAKIIGANGHFHSRGTKFEMYTWDGSSIDTPPESQKFYSSAAWNDPPMERWPELDVSVPAGGGIFYSCSYQWQPPDPSIGCQGLNAYDKTKNQITDDSQLDCCYAFGPIVEKNEHCNAFVYYYPKQDDITCF